MAPRKSKPAEITATEYKEQQQQLEQLMTIDGVRQQIIAAIKSNTIDTGKELIEIDKKALEVAKSFGVGRDNIVNIKSALASARDGVIDLGGSYTDLVTQQVEASKAVGRNVLLTAEAQKDLYAASQVTNQSVTDMVGKMKDVGISAFEAGKRMGDVVNAARQAGVSAEVVSALVLKNTDALNRYNFRDGVEGLSKMAAQAVSMRFDMAETFKIAEKAFSPEGAIKMSAELQRLGVTQSALLDPLYLMNLAENDPAELQNQITDLSKSFVELNEKGQFQIMPGSGRRLRAIAESLGVSYSEMSKMAIASRELEDKMQRISLPDNLFKDEEQKNLFRGMFEMRDGEYKIQLGTKELGIQDAIKELEKTPGLLEKTLADSKPKTMEELAKEQLGYLELIATGINALKGRVPAALSAVPEAEQLLSGFSKLGKAVPEKISDAIFGSTKDLAEGLQPKMKKIGEQFGDIFKIPDSYKDAKENLNKLGEFLKDLGKSAMESTKDVYGKGKEKTKETIEELGEWLGPEFLADWESMTGGDTLIRPDTKQIIQLDPNDAIYATKNPVFPSSLMEQVPKIETTKETLTIPNIPQTKIETNEGQSKLDVDMKLQIPNLPPNIDTAQLMSILNSTFKDQNFIEKLIQEIARIKTNNNLTPMRK